MNVLEVLDLAEAKVIDTPDVDFIDDILLSTNPEQFYRSHIERNKKVKSMFKDGVVFSEGVEILRSAENDVLHKVTVESPKLPVAKLSSIKSLCDSFGFIIIPYECYNKEHFFNKDSEYSPEIKAIVEEIVAKNVCNSKFYVITPIGNYDIRAHVMYNGDKQLYLGQHSTLLGGVMLQIPLFKEIFGRLEAAEKNIISLDKQIESINDEIGKLKDRQIEQQLRSLELFEAIERIRRPIDPILISIDTDEISTCNGDDLCSIHYQWGPDFTDEVAIALNLEVKKQQSEMCFNMFNSMYSEDRLDVRPEDAKLLKIIAADKSKISENIVRILNTESLSFLHDKYWDIFHNSNPSTEALQKVYSQCGDKFKLKALNLMLWR